MDSFEEKGVMKGGADFMCMISSLNDLFLHPSSPYKHQIKTPACPIK